MAGAYASMAGTTALTPYPDTPPTACVADAFSGRRAAAPTLAKRAREAYDPLRTAAQSPAAALSPDHLGGGGPQAMRAYDPSTPPALPAGDRSVCIAVVNGVSCQAP
jgi:hypothetical protein